MTARDWFNITLIVVIAAALVVISAGCAHDTSPASSLPAVGEGLSGITADNDTAERAVVATVPHADATGKAFLAVASEAHKSVAVRASETRDWLLKGEAESRATATDRDLWKTKYQAIYDSPIEKAWRWIEWIFWLSVGLFAAANIAAIVLPIAFPGWGLIASKAIVRFMPAMNLASFVRDKFTTKTLPSTA